MNEPVVKVLLVEDNKGDYRLAQEMLSLASRTKFDLTWVDNYDAGLKELQNTHDVALLDYRLGGHSGLDLLRAARAAGCSIPLIMLTGIEDPVIDELALATGAADFLPKGEITPGLLERSIRHALDRKRAEDALRESELKFRSVTESASEAIIATDADGRIISWNRGAEMMFGYVADEVMGKPILNLMPERQHEELQQRLSRVRPGGVEMASAQIIQLYGLSKSGNEFPVELSLSSWRTGNATYFALIIRDITQRKIAENRLGDERNLLRAIIDNVPDHIYVKDLQGRYLLDNVAHRTFLGAEEPEDVVGKTVFDLFPPELASLYNADDVAVLRSSRPLVDREEPMVDRPHGTNLWFSTTKVPLNNAEGKMTGIVCLSRDVTSRKKAEEERDRSEHALRKALSDLEKSHGELKATQMVLIQAEKLESLGRLAAGIAHEVKNPLGQVLLAADFLLKAIPPAETVWAEVLNDIRRAVIRMDTILRGMLDFSAPNDLNLRPENLSAPIDQALMLLKSELMKNHIKVERQFGEGLPQVDIDQSKLEQVFINLCTNAMHAMPEGGTLTVRTYTETLAEGEREDGARVMGERMRAGERVVVAEVADTGHGIPPEKIAMIFDPFFTTKATGKGTGLGLTVTRKIVELHGGRIEIKNRPEGGAAAAITLKARTEA
jgi:PAS domain S-box-containing protein